MKMGIYIITNVASNKHYIGSTISFQRRWKEHRNKLHQGRHSNLHLQHAWNKYGRKAFDFEVLEYLDDPKKLHLAEQFWMDIYRLEGKELYNYGLIAHKPALGYKHTKEARRKISNFHRGRYTSEETRQKISKAKKGKTLSKEHCHKISMGNKGKHHASMETRAKLAAVKAKSYPAFHNRTTGEVIPAGINLRALCRERNLNQTCMCAVKTGRRRQHQNWVLGDGI